MMIIEALEHILLSPELKDKLTLLPPDSFRCTLDSKVQTLSLRPLTPGRSTVLAFSEKQIKFPKRENFHLPQSRALALHSFANHELMAIELMCEAYLFFTPQLSVSERAPIQRGLIKAIGEEQKHLALYITQLEKEGFQFGDFPLNDFFWRQFRAVENIWQFFALMSLTFESANLDFSKFYEKIFRAVGEVETANVLEEVYQDELSHVAFGAKHLRLSNKSQDTLWKYYLSLLPFPMTPARAKGIGYNPVSRKLAGLEADWVHELTHYRDDFPVHHRRGLPVDKHE
jgi:uncharacterized ferritin-like protein (DUF455 family)